MTHDASGLIGTAVGIGILGLGIGLFAQGVNNAQRSLGQQRRRRGSNGFNILDPMVNNQRPKQRRARRNDDIFNLDLF